MKYLEKLLASADRSQFSLWKLNLVLRFIIPFNRPLRIRIVSLTDSSIRVSLPHIRANFNHLRGLHACSMATAAEFASGILLLRRLQASRYRIIMKSMSVEYFYQGLHDAEVTLELDQAWFEEHVFSALTASEPALVAVSPKVYDIDGNHLCTATLTWQIKDWRSVQTPV